MSVNTGSPPLNTTGQPLARYAAVKRFGDHLFCSGVIAVDPSGTVLERYDQLPEAALRQLETLGYHTGQFSVDVFEVPIVVQSWAILERIRTMIEPHGASLALAISRLIKSASVSGRRSAAMKHEGACTQTGTDRA